MFRIKAPMSSFSGAINSVRFRAGVAEAPLEADAVDWFKARGYRVAEIASSEPDAPEPSYAELKEQAKELGIPASGKKDELAAAIAAEKTRLEAQEFTATMTELPASSGASEDSVGKLVEASGDDQEAAS